MRESATHLHIAVSVVDDDVQHHTDRLARDQDAITIYVDPRAPDVRDRNMDIGRAVMSGDLAATVGTIAALGDTSPDNLLGFIEETNANTEQRVRRTPNGYDFEMAIPLTYLAAKAGGEWRAARIAVSAYDLDGGAHGPESLHWQPWRYGDAPLSGSHLFGRPESGAR